jgi:hypothetical protein
MRTHWANIQANQAFDAGVAEVHPKKQTRVISVLEGHNDAPADNQVGSNPVEYPCPGSHGSLNLHFVIDQQMAE